MGSWETRLTAVLEKQRAAGAFRTLNPISERAGLSIRRNGQALLNFGSNDYLGLSHDRALVQGACASAEKWGVGAQSSRLVSGSTVPVSALEQRFSHWLGKDASLLVNTGFSANLGLISALAGKDTVIFSDRLNHASIYDGIVLSRAVLKRYRHGDAAHLATLLEATDRAQAKIIITESVFSMNGDRAPLEELATLAEQYDALFIVDEAHSLGVFGEQGQGLVHQMNLTDRVDIIVSPLGKSVGAMGAFISGSSLVIDYLVNVCRPFIFTTGISPLLVGAIDAGLSIMQQEARGRVVLARAGRLRSWLLAQNVAMDGSESHIIPVVVGASEAAVALMRYLEENGVFVPAIRPPTVPVNQARLRLSVCYFHTDEDVDRVADLIGRGWERQ